MSAKKGKSNGSANGHGANGHGKPSANATPPEPLEEQLAKLPPIEAPTYVVDARDGDEPQPPDDDDVDPSHVSKAKSVHAYFRERVEAKRQGLPLPLPPPALADRIEIAKPSRPPLTREMIDAIVQRMKLGATVTRAGEALGISCRYLRWLIDLGSVGYSPLHVELYERTEQERAVWEVAMLGTIATRQHNWQANAWLLQQSFPDRYAWSRWRPDLPTPGPTRDAEGETKPFTLYLPALEKE